VPHLNEGFSLGFLVGFHVPQRLDSIRSSINTGNLNTQRLSDLCQIQRIGMDCARLPRQIFDTLICIPVNFINKHAPRPFPRSSEDRPLNHAPIGCSAKCWQTRRVRVVAFLCARYPLVWVMFHCQLCNPAAAKDSIRQLAKCDGC
jgi:hypothetical protein